MNPRLSVLALSLLMWTVGCSDQTDPQYAAEIDTWHLGRVERLTRPDGWLTLVGLHPLADGLNTVGSAADQDVRLIEKAPAQLGELTLHGDQIVFSTRPGVEVRHKLGDTEEPVGRMELKSDASGPPTLLSAGSLLFYVIQRGDRRFLRVKDTRSEILETFQGIDRFGVKDRWRVTARLEKGADTVAVANVLGQVEEAPSPGVLVFKLKGREHKLIPQGEPGKGLFIVFGDNTNGQATYSGGRFLSTDPPLDDGTVILDFNKAVNPPCVFTEYATCPIPPVDNLLDVRIEAGEKMWGAAH